MSLLCDYSDSSSASSGSEDDERVTVPFTSAPAPRQQVSLPSADELFASDTSLALSSSNSVSMAYRSNTVTATSGSTASDAAKRRLQESELNASAKRLKPTPTTAATRKAVAHFAPPQLKRPNVSTEDLGAWNTQKTLAMQRKAKSQQPTDL